MTPRLPGRLATLLDHAHPYYRNIPKEDRARMLRLPLAATAEEVDEVAALRLAAWPLEHEWYARAEELRCTRHEMTHEDSLAAFRGQHELSLRAVAASDVAHRASLALVKKYAATPTLTGQAGEDRQGARGS